MSELRPGIRIGLDLGAARIGVARTDPSGLLATPLGVGAGTSTWDDAQAPARLVIQIAQWLTEETPPPADVPRQTQWALDQFEQWRVLEFVVGLPVALSGEAELAAQTIQQQAQVWGILVQPVPVRLVDERFTTVVAQRQLREAGMSSRKGRKHIDAQAAVNLLTYALDLERPHGQAPGELVAVSAQEEHA